MQNSTDYGRLIRLALPIMASNLLHTLYNLVDAWFLGRLGPAEVAAPSIAMNIVFFLIVFGMGFSTAGATLISQSKGRGNRERMDFYLGQMAGLLWIASLLIATGGYAAVEPILRLLHVPEDAFAGTRGYLRIVLLGIPFMCTTFIMQSAFQGTGDSLRPLIVQAVTVSLNIVLDRLLIFGAGPIPAMGVNGAALGTLIARGVSASVSLFLLLHGRRIRLRAANLKPEKAAVRLLLDIGLPTSLGSALSALGFNVLQGLVNSFGTSVIAAFGVGNRIISLFNMPAIGFGRATAIMVGHNLGARNREGAWKVVKQSVLTVFLFILCGMSLTFFKGASVVRFFVDDPAVIREGAVMFRLVSPSVVFFTLFTTLSGAFQGGGDTKPVLFLNVLRLWGLRVPIAYALHHFAGLGPSSVYMAMIASNVLTAAVGFLLLRRGRWLTKIDPDSI